MKLTSLVTPLLAVTVTALLGYAESQRPHPVREVLIAATAPDARLYAKCIELTELGIRSGAIGSVSFDNCLRYKPNQEDALPRAKTSTSMECRYGDLWIQWDTWTTFHCSENSKWVNYNDK